MMAEVRQDGEQEGVADSHDPFARLADASAKLFAEQAAAMAMMTAFGMSVAGQMTGLMMNALRTGEDKAGEQEKTAAEPVSAAEAGDNVVHLRPASVKATAQKVKSEAAKPARAKAPATADDLKLISGIGPRLEKVLNGRGIVSYRQIAGLDKAALARIDEELGLEGRVTRDNWVGQAKALAAGRG